MISRVSRADPNDKKNDAYAFDLLVGCRNHIIELGMKDSLAAIDLLLRKYSNHNDWNWDLLEDLNNLYRLEITQESATLSKSLKIIEGILQNIFGILKNQNKIINLHDVRWTPEQANHLDNILGPLVASVNGQINKTTLIYLLAIGYIMVFELKFNFLMNRIGSWHTQAGLKVEMKLIEESLSIVSLASDGKSDSRHIRNALAHGHFEILPNDQIRLWDCKPGQSKNNFDLSVDIIKIGEYFNLLQKIVGMIEMHTHLIIATEILWRKYHPDLKIVKVNW